MNWKWMVYSILITSIIIVSTSTADLLAYTVYSDMSGSESLQIWGYSHTDISSQDWHYQASTINQTLRDPNGNPVTGSGSATYASISKQYTIEGNYSLMARHELYCTLHNALVTPVSVISAHFSIRTTYFTDPTPITGGCYYNSLACTPGTTPTCTGGWGIAFLGGTCPTFAVADFLVGHYESYHICTIAVGSGASGPGDCS